MTIDIRMACGKPKPFCGLPVILFYPEAFCIYLPKSEQGICKILFS